MLESVPLLYRTSAARLIQSVCTRHHQEICKTTKFTVAVHLKSIFKSDKGIQSPWPVLHSVSALQCLFAFTNAYNKNLQPFRVLVEYQKIQSNLIPGSSKYALLSRGQPDDHRRNRRWLQQTVNAMAMLQTVAFICIFNPFLGGIMSSRSHVSLKALLCHFFHQNDSHCRTVTATNRWSNGSLEKQKPGNRGNPTSDYHLLIPPFIGTKNSG